LAQVSAIPNFFPAVQSLLGRFSIAMCSYGVQSEKEVIKCFVDRGKYAIY
jgi:hypothetical protein